MTLRLMYSAAVVIDAVTEEESSLTLDDLVDVALFVAFVGQVVVTLLLLLLLLLLR